MSAEHFKEQGNIAIREERFADAIDSYTQAIKLDQLNHILYSNRSLAYVKTRQYDLALKDAEQTISLKPDWAKGHARKGSALKNSGDFEAAIKCLEHALLLESSNEAIRNELEEARKEFAQSKGGYMNPFADPRSQEKLKADPRTKLLFKDPSYEKMLNELFRSPDSIRNYMNDPRLMTTLSVLLGIDVQNVTDDSSQPMETDSPSPSAAKSEPVQSHKAGSPDLNSNEQLALKHKDKGNDAYKKKDFVTALTHYDKAVELEPDNISFRTNRAAVYFEQGNLDKCIEECQQAIEIGREHKADFKLIAKAYARIGNAYNKMERLDDALNYYNKSLSEFRDPDVVKKVQQIQKTIAERERLAYIDPQKAEEAKQKGNEFFTQGNYPEGLKYYTEAIKRNPKDARLYSNRAACYNKLMEFNMALADCETCLKIDPSFVKGYLRKGACLLALKDPLKAKDAFRKALDLDPDCQEALDGLLKCKGAENDPEAVKRRAMQDPEVQQILTDPAMRIILEQMESDPSALYEHMRNPDIQQKIEKLIDVGVIRLGHR